MQVVKNEAFGNSWAKREDRKEILALFVRRWKQTRTTQAKCWRFD